jgi:beta-glucosidase-like glycosyl hydrolase
MFSGATIFPEELALGSTFDVPLVESVYSAAAQESRADDGWPVLDDELIRNPRALSIGARTRLQSKNGSE